MKLPESREDNAKCEPHFRVDVHRKKSKIDGWAGDSMGTAMIGGSHVTISHALHNRPLRTIRALRRRQVTSVQ